MCNENFLQWPRLVLWRVRLSRFYFNYGHIGHLRANCTWGVIQEYLLSLLSYGPWMKAKGETTRINWTSPFKPILVNFLFQLPNLNIIVKGDTHNTHMCFWKRGEPFHELHKQIIIHCISVCLWSFFRVLSRRLVKAKDYRLAYFKKWDCRGWLKRLERLTIVELVT